MESSLEHSPAYEGSTYESLAKRAAAVEAARKLLHQRFFAGDEFAFISYCYRCAGVMQVERTNDFLAYLGKMFHSMHEVRQPEEGDCVTWPMPHGVAIVEEWPKKIIQLTRDGIIRVKHRLSKEFHYRFFSPFIPESVYAPIERRVRDISVRHRRELHTPVRKQLTGR